MAQQSLYRGITMSQLRQERPLVGGLTGDELLFMEQGGLTKVALTSEFISAVADVIVALGLPVTVESVIGLLDAGLIDPDLLPNIPLAKLPNIPLTNVIGLMDGLTIDPDILPPLTMPTWLRSPGVGAVARTYENKLQEAYITPQDFGPVATDESADTVADITQAYTAAIAAKRNLYLPAGRYRINSALPFTSNQRIKIFGDGMFNTVLVVHADLGAAVNCSLTEGTAGSLNLEIEDLAVEERAAGLTAGVGTSAFRFEYRGGVTIRRVRIGRRDGTGSFDYGMDFVWSCPSMRIEECYFNRCHRYGLRAGYTIREGAGDWSAHNAVIHRNVFYGCGLPAPRGAGLYLRAGMDMTITENDASDNWVHFLFDACNGANLHGNHWENDPASLAPSVLVKQPLEFGPSVCTLFDITGNTYGRSPNHTIANLQKSKFRNALYDCGTITFAASCPDLDFSYNPSDLVLSTAVGRTPWTAVPLTGAWANVPGFAPLSCRTKANGQLEIRGKVGGGAAASFFGTLPANYRPQFTSDLACARGAAVRIFDNGTMLALTLDSDNQVCLDGTVMTIT